ncbi:ABC transporter permease [Martelella mediterranea]|uniref:Peptide/nickel transport system permease protein n=1 Tax=Martelella mediterranea TaxID=293089 RepID=A0A4R3NWT9_9HYPH|nr:ABC transporter permease [Martelella mediterranea]TCT42808.1 peptide/nickel transport system permease protein [Martelella mediterranea]
MAELEQRQSFEPLVLPRMGNRVWTLTAALIGFMLILLIPILAVLTGPAGVATDFAARLSPPDWAHLFGTDQMGHDLLARTIKGLRTSLWVGLLASCCSVVIATALALVATAGGRFADAIVSLLVDATIGLPHLVLLILICFALGGGPVAVTVAVALTHWPRLTRILRAEVLQVRQADYVVSARHFGKSWGVITIGHILPQILPQMLVGLVLMFPHAILHEASLTFLGFGLDPTRPAIGVMLSDSMRYLTAGKWWLGLFPGLCLLLLVLSFDAVGNGVRLILDPRTAQT